MKRDRKNEEKGKEERILVRGNGHWRGGGGGGKLKNKKKKVEKKKKWGDEKENKSILSRFEPLILA